MTSTYAKRRDLLAASQACAVEVCALSAQVLAAISTRPIDDAEIGRLDQARNEAGKRWDKALQELGALFKESEG